MFQEEVRNDVEMATLLFRMADTIEEEAAMIHRKKKEKKKRRRSKSHRSSSHSSHVKFDAGDDPKDYEEPDSYRGNTQ